MYIQQHINCKGRLLDLTSPKVMGILNLTPDSFFDGGQYLGEEAYLKQAEQMLEDGAEVLDIGGMSSRPGAAIITEEEELQRVIKPIHRLHREFPEAIISIDTVRAKVASEAVAAGSAIINDISAGGIDNLLFQTAAQLKVPYILMHMQGTPENMQKQPSYDAIVTEVLDFLIAKIELLRSLGVKDIIVDPGFGFGKTLEHNYQLLSHLHAFKILGLPILAGVSRKSMISKLLNIKTAEALNGTTAVHMLALAQGVQLLRVHDVKEAVQAIKIWEMYQQYDPQTPNY